MECSLLTGDAYENFLPESEDAIVAADTINRNEH
jgi:hypothetical protein